MANQEKIGFLGGDVSKGYCNFILTDSLDQLLEANFQLDDNKEGHKKLVTLLESFKVQHKLTKIVVGVESTGGYENNWVRNLRSKSEILNLEVFRINPKFIYHETKAVGHRSVDDGVSALTIAGFLRKNYGSKYVSKKQLESGSDEINHLDSMKKMNRYIQSLTRQSNRIKNSFEKLLYNNMPEMLSMKGDKYPKWFLRMLQEFPSKRKILSADIEELTKIPFLTKSKAITIIKALEESIGAEADEYMEITMQEQADDIFQLQNKIERLKKSISELARKQESVKEDIEIITSINGIAENTAVGILTELGDVNKFEKAKNVPAFWGINPTIKQSGDKMYTVGMSKDGSRNARAILYMAARNVIMHEPYFSDLYYRMKGKGKSHRSAEGIVMNKLSRVIYGMLKSRKKFDKKIDIKNQKKKLIEKVDRKAKESRTTKERRYQEKTINAPISRVQRSKRKQKQTVPN